MPSASPNPSKQAESESSTDSTPTDSRSGNENSSTKNALHTDEVPTSTSSPSASSSSADHIVETLHRVDKKVETMRQNRLQDPDTLGDKLLKIVLPTALGALAGKVFKTIWDNQVTNRRTSTGGNDAEDAQQQGLIASIIFAAASAAFGSIISTLGTRGSNALVTRRQNRRSGR